jgi:perosamine synthetase
MTTGEGGMITTNDEAFYEKCRYLRDHAMSKTKRYWHTELGYNFRMTNLQAALGCAQLQRIGYFLQRRCEIHTAYQEFLHILPSIRLNRTLPGYTNSYWLICMEFEAWNAASRDMFMRQLADTGIDSRPYFYPMSHMPYYKKANTPVAEKMSTIGINLPTFTDMRREEIKRICEGIIYYLSR